MASERVTMQDIADALSVSRATVDRVLNARGRVSPSTVERVLETARKLGFSPNPIARELALSRKLRMAVVCPIEPRRFFDGIRRGMKAAESDLSGYGVELLDGLHDRLEPRVQRDALAKAMQSDVDAIAIAPAHHSELNHLIDEAVDAGIAVVTVNTDAPLSRRHFHVGHNFWRAGRMAGEMMVRFLESGSHAGSSAPLRVAQLAGLWKTTSRVDRLRGFQESVSEYAHHIELSGPHIFDDSVEDAASIAAELLDGPSPPVGFFSTSGDGHVAVARELLKRGLGGRVRNIGFDVDPAVRELIRRNAIHAALDQDPHTQGYIAIQMLYRHMRQQPLTVGSVYHTRIEVVLRSNVDMPAEGTRLVRAPLEQSCFR